MEAIVCWVDELLWQGDSAHRFSLVWGSFWGVLLFYSHWTGWCSRQLPWKRLRQTCVCVSMSLRVCVCVCKALISCVLCLYVQHFCIYPHCFCVYVCSALKCQCPMSFLFPRWQPSRGRCLTFWATNGLPFWPTSST